MLRRFIVSEAKRSLKDAVRIEGNAARSWAKTLVQMVPEVGVLDALHEAHHAYLIRRHLEKVCGPEPKRGDYE